MTPYPLGPPALSQDIDAFRDIVPFILADPAFAGIDIIECPRSRHEHGTAILTTASVVLTFYYDQCDNIGHALSDHDIRQSFLTDLHDLAYNGDEASSDMLLRSNDGYNKLLAAAPPADPTIHTKILGIERHAILRAVTEGPSRVTYGHLRLRVDFALA